MDKIKALVRSRYKNSLGQPFELTDGQAEIFEVIVKRKYPRVHCISYTQFGKSDTVAMAVLTRITTYPEKWAIVAPSNKKAHIIMSYLIGHIFDNEYTTALFEVEKGDVKTIKEAILPKWGNVEAIGCAIRGDNLLRLKIDSQLIAIKRLGFVK